MIKRSTWIILAILALVIGAYFLIKNLPERADAEITPTEPASAFLVTEADGLLVDLRIFDGTTIFEMQRNEYNAWAVLLPVPGSADLGLAGAAEAQVIALRIVATIETPPALSDMGLESPAHVIRLGFEDGGAHKIDVGNLTPTQSGYYVQYDDETIYIVSQDGIDALLNLLTAPPYPPTATPSLEPTPAVSLETATPTP